MIVARGLARLHAASFITPPPWSEVAFHDLLAAKSTVLQADGAGDALRGFVLGRVILDEAELLTIATDPAVRRAGVAGTLLRRFMDEVRARGAKTVFLDVSAENAPALALYQKAGFQPLARRKGYYAIPGEIAQDALILHKSL